MCCQTASVVTIIIFCRIPITVILFSKTVIAGTERAPSKYVASVSNLPSPFVPRYVHYSHLYLSACHPNTINPAEALTGGVACPIKMVRPLASNWRVPANTLRFRLSEHFNTTQEQDENRLWYGTGHRPPEPIMGKPNTAGAKLGKKLPATPSTYHFFFRGWRIFFRH